MASQAYERAGALADDGGRRCALLYAAADTAWLGGLATRAVELLDAARRYSPPAHVAVSVEHLRGHIATRLGPVDEGQRILLEGAEMAADVEADRAVVMLAEAVNAAFYAGDAAAMRNAAARIPSLLEPNCSRRTGAQEERTRRVAGRPTRREQHADLQLLGGQLVTRRQVAPAGCLAGRGKLRPRHVRPRVRAKLIEDGDGVPEVWIRS